MHLPCRHFPPNKHNTTTYPSVETNGLPSIFCSFDRAAESCEAFKSPSGAEVMVCTNLASRGLDFSSLKVGGVWCGQGGLAGGLSWCLERPAISGKVHEKNTLLQRCYGVMEVLSCLTKPYYLGSSTHKFCQLEVSHTRIN